MKTIFAVFLFIHGILHFVTFLTHWNILRGRNNKKQGLYGLPAGFNLGPGGVRITGLLFLVAGIVFLYLGYEMLAGVQLFWEYIWRTTIVSLVLCIISWPGARFGVIANGLLITFLMFNDIYHWIQ